MLRVAMIAEPGEADLQRTLTTLVYLARDYLSMAERMADDPSSDNFAVNYNTAKNAATHVRAARSMMASAQSLTSEVSCSEPTRLQTVGSWLQRAIHASDAAGDHIEHYASYNTKRPDQLESSQRDQARKIWRRSTQQARKECHRALAELCELFPDSYSIDDLAAEG